MENVCVHCHRHLKFKRGVGWIHMVEGEEGGTYVITCTECGYEDSAPHGTSIPEHECYMCGTKGKWRDNHCALPKM